MRLKTVFSIEIIIGACLAITGALVPHMTVLSVIGIYALVPVILVTAIAWSLIKRNWRVLVLSFETAAGLALGILLVMQVAQEPGGAGQLAAPVIFMIALAVTAAVVGITASLWRK